jgi:hypothetical protein
MTWAKNGKTSTLSAKRVDTSSGEFLDTSTPAENRLYTGFSEEKDQNSEKSNVQPDPTTGVDIIPEFLGAKKAAELLGIKQRSVNRNCDSGKYEGAKKTLVDGVEVWQIPIASLPAHAQSMMREAVKAAALERVAVATLPLATPLNMKFSPAEYSIIWEEYERSGENHKRRAEAAFEALLAFQRLVDDGFSIGEAEKQIASRHGVSKPTLWRYRQATKDHPQMHWKPLLSPRYKGGRPPAEFTEEAYGYILVRTLNTSETPWNIVFEEARELAKVNGWVIPGDDAIRYRLAKEPKWLDTMGRKGPKALERSYPAIRRNYESLALHELWESDGRKSDVFCLWPDGTIARPFIIVWREVRSRLVLGVKGYLNPSAAGVISAFGMALARAGTAPDFAKIDNGREYAAKSVTGGQANRYRFPVVPGEQPGIMTLCGTKAEWSKPGRGQDKPIESFWRFVADRCDKAPEFEGAYCGRNPVEKPENFDRRKAIPIAFYGAKLAKVLEYFNIQHRHSGSGMDGRTPLEVYTELSANMARPPVDPAHIRLCKMGVASIKPSAVDASYILKIPGYGTCRYWSKKIAGLPLEVLSRKHSVYYDLENPSAPVSIYDGHAWLDDAPQFEELPFRNAGEGAAAHVKDKNALLKPQIAAVKQMKAAAQPDFPALPGVTGLSELPPPIHSVTISGTRKPGLSAEKPPAHSASILTDEDEKELAERARIQQERRRKANPALYQHVGN